MRLHRCQERYQAALITILAHLNASGALLNLDPLGDPHALKGWAAVECQYLRGAEGAIVGVHVVHVDVGAAEPWVVAEVERSVVAGCARGKCVLGVEVSVDITAPLVASFHAGDVGPGAHRQIGDRVGAFVLIRRWY